MGLSNVPCGNQQQLLGDIVHILRPRLRFKFFGRRMFPLPTRHIRRHFFISLPILSTRAGRPWQRNHRMYSVPTRLLQQHGAHQLH